MMLRPPRNPLGTAIALLALTAFVGVACADVWGFRDLAGGDAGASAEGGQLDAFTATDGAVTVDVVDGGAAVDTGTSDGAVVDAGPDGVVPSDGGPVPGDAAEAGCEPVDGSTYNCGVGVVIDVTTPGAFCVEDYTTNQSLTPTTPAACQCASTFTCACLEASYAPPGGWCASSSATVGCYCEDKPQGIGPVVYCGYGCNCGSGCSY